MKEKNRTVVYRLIVRLACVFQVIILLFQLELSDKNDSLSIIFFFLNFFTIYCAILICTIFFKWYQVINVFNIIVTIIALINSFVIDVRGFPISAADISNIPTALNVAGSYKLNFSLDYIMILAACAINLGISKKITKSCKVEAIVKKRIIRNILIVLGTMLFVYVGYLMPNSIKPKSTFAIAWDTSYKKYGFIPCTIETFSPDLSVMTRPEYYSDEYAYSVMENLNYLFKSQEDEKPDIILILNESWYDLELIADLKADIDCFKSIYELDNSITGYTFVNGSGGMTNISEYELLTSNSTQLLKGRTPFNVLNLTNQKSVVSFLKNMGYTTLATHPEASKNYSRGKAYPQIGFDEVFFEDDYIDVDYYGDGRNGIKGLNYITDDSAFTNLIRMYEDMDKNSPRFLFMLTIQNHSPYDLNSEEYDIVHAKTDFGEWNDDVDEYLTCIYQSNQAFLKLIDYFQRCDRKAVICMLGDHSPYIASDIANKEMDENERVLKLHSTPYIIWANYELNKNDTQWAHISYFIPYLLDILEIPKSGYYQFLYHLKFEVPFMGGRITFMIKI